MSHTVKTLPSYHMRNKWLEGGESALSRLLSNRAALDHVGAKLVLDALLAGAWVPHETDIRGDFPALLALMGGYHLRDVDATSVKADHVQIPVMSAEEQDIALFLVQSGCKVDASFPPYFSDADSMDVALAVSADRFLEKHMDKVDWQSRTLMGLPWLHYASRSSQPSVVKLLIDSGADVDQVDEKGNTPLFYASSAATVDLLVQAGASGFCLNLDGKTAQAYWETVRGIKGDVNRKMVLSLRKANSTLSHDQEVEQFFVMAQGASKGRLEKELRRLKLDGSEKVNGVGLLAQATHRSILDMTSGGRGIEENNTRNWLDFVASWPRALAAADVGELAIAALVAKLTLASKAKDKLEDEVTLRQEGQSDGKVWVDAVKRFLLPGIKLNPATTKVLFDTLVRLPHPIENAPLMLDIVALDTEYGGMRKEMLQLCELVRDAAPDPAWENPELAEGLVAFCLRHSHGNKQIEQTQSTVMDLALEISAHIKAWSPGLCAMLKGEDHGGSDKTPSTAVIGALSKRQPHTADQMRFIQDMRVSLDASMLARSIPSTTHTQRRPRL